MVDKDKKSLDPLQLAIIKDAQEKGKPIGIHLLTGVVWEGVVIGHDMYCVLLQTEKGGRRLIYKHAITDIELSPLTK